MDWSLVPESTVTEVSMKATPPSDRKFIKILSLLILLTMVVSIVIATTYSPKVDSITENDIPLGIGETSVMAAVFSIISPIDLLEEIDFDKKKKLKEEKETSTTDTNDRNKNSNQKPKKESKWKRWKKRLRPRRMRPRKMHPKRRLKKISRFFKAFFRKLLGK